MAFSEDLDPLFADFGVDIRITPKVGMRYTLTGIFDIAHYEYDDVSGVGLEGRQPRLVCRSSDLHDPQHGDQVEVEGTTYRITNIQPDGTGVTELWLQA